MFWFIWQLITPLNYLRIRHGNGFYFSKRMFDWGLPLFFAAVIVGICKLLGQPLSLDRSALFFSSVTNILALLIAFFMAALAAVATFDRPGLDTEVVNPNAVLWRYVAKLEVEADENLSYREFICYVFGFLSFVSLLVYIFIVFHQLVWDKIAELLLPFNLYLSGVLLSWAEIIGAVLFFLFVFVCCQLFVTALLGIHFLTERIQTLMKP